SPKKHHKNMEQPSTYNSDLAQSSNVSDPIISKGKLFKKQKKNLRKKTKQKKHDNQFKVEKEDEDEDEEEEDEEEKDLDFEDEIIYHENKYLNGYYTIINHKEFDKRKSRLAFAMVLFIIGIGVIFGSLIDI